MKRFVYIALAMLMPGMLLAAPVKLAAENRRHKRSTCSSKPLFDK